MGSHCYIMHILHILLSKYIILLSEQVVDPQHVCMTFSMDFLKFGKINFLNNFFDNINLPNYSVSRKSLEKFIVSDLRKSIEKFVHACRESTSPTTSKPLCQHSRAVTDGWLNIDLDDNRVMALGGYL
jgi:hypothetical protein